MNARGYTLVEILTTMAIIAALAGISFPLFQGLARRSHAGSCAANLRQIGVGLNLYLNENGMRMPVMQAAVPAKTDDRATIDTVLREYVGEELAFRCPADDKGLFESTGTSYFWNSLLNGQPALSLKFLTIEDEIGIPIASDKENFHSGIGDEVNILYADGRVEKDIQFWIE